MTRLTRRKYWFLSAALVLSVSSSVTPTPSSAAGAVPGLPYNAVVSQRNLNSLLVSWNAPRQNPQSVVDYELRLSQDFGITWEVFSDGVSPSTQTELTGLDRRKDYLLQVRAVGEGGQSDWVLVSTGPYPVQISAGGLHSCAALSDGSVRCWGQNDYGQLGDGTMTSSLTPVSVSGVDNAVEISAAFNQTCALLSDGQISCWGANDAGQLGDGTTAGRLLPTTVVGINNATQVVTGGAHSCALLADGSVKCWGQNLFGELGDGTTQNALLPQEVPGVIDVIEIAAGSVNSCALLASRKVLCWGDNSLGQVGDGTNVDRRTPTEVSGLTDVKQIEQRFTNTCAVLIEGSVKCWGRNTFGELGDGTLENRSIPTLVSSLSDVVQVSPGLGQSACAMLVDGSVKCWGLNGYGQLGDGTFISQTIPVTTRGITTSRQLSVGTMHACALLIDGTISCWGSNAFGQLGDGTTASRSIAALVASLSPSTISLPKVPAPPTTITQTGKSSSSISATWSQSDGDGLVIDSYKVEYSKDGQVWKSAIAESQSVEILNLDAATAYQYRVSGHSAAGWGSPSESIIALTSGTRAMKIGITSAKGLGVTGGSISWATSDDSYSSANPFGLTQNGLVEFPRVPAGWSNVVAKNVSLSDGSQVDGRWLTLLGKSMHDLSIPEGPGTLKRSVKVLLPNGLPVVGANVTVVGLERSVVQGDFSFSVAAAIASGKTGTDGVFTAVGYASGTPVATITYDDGTLIQRKQVALSSSQSVVTLDEMPWLELSSKSAIANINSVVTIPVVLLDSYPMNLTAAIDGRIVDVLATHGFNREASRTSNLRNSNEVKISVSAPAGAGQNCKGKRLSARIPANGKASLKVCATKSGEYKISGSGAAATSAFLLKVRGAAPMPVTAASGLSPSIGQAKFSWNPPFYTGGSVIREYIVTLTGGGRTIKKSIKSSTVTFSQLKNATTYSATIQAVTKFGISDKVSVKVGVA